MSGLIASSGSKKASDADARAESPVSAPGDAKANGPHAIGMHSDLSYNVFQVLSVSPSI